MILLSDIVEANADLMMADLEGEAVLLNIQSGRYFGLNEVGTSIWSLIKEPQSVSEILGALSQIYDAPAEALHHDVLTFLNDMEKRSLLHVITTANV